MTLEKDAVEGLERDGGGSGTIVEAGCGGEVESVGEDREAVAAVESDEGCRRGGESNGGDGVPLVATSGGGLVDGSGC